MFYYDELILILILILIPICIDQPSSNNLFHNPPSQSPLYQPPIPSINYDSKPSIHNLTSISHNYEYSTNPLPITPP